MLLFHTLLKCIRWAGLLLHNGLHPRPHAHNIAVKTLIGLSSVHTHLYHESSEHLRLRSKPPCAIQTPFRVVHLKQLKSGLAKWDVLILRDGRQLPNGTGLALSGATKIAWDHLWKPTMVQQNRLQRPLRELAPVVDIYSNLILGREWA